jgi:hypothetical protein
VKNKLKGGSIVNARVRVIENTNGANFEKRTKIKFKQHLC